MNFRRDNRRTTSTAAAARLLLAFAMAAGLFPFGPAARAEEPGRGLTAPFEVKFLKDTINHHFAALRMTELAAGTDAVRDPEISPAEGTSPTPGFQPTPPKAALDEVKSMAREANRVQREEILRSQRFLRQWYGINHQPQITPVNQARIEILEQAQGRQFDHLFLEIFSRHHFTITVRSLECLTSSELRHDELKRMCRAILESQLVQIDEMRHLLCKYFQICDYQPLSGIKGVHSGDDGEIHPRYNRFRNVTRDEDEDNEDHYEGNVRPGQNP
jgi:uncharacterized protein (DUF305 family)